MKLIITVEFLCRRYHGRNLEQDLEDFPPSPLRLFQALIAASHRGIYRKQNSDIRDNALRWLEKLAPPIIIAGERQESGEDKIDYVPNNDERFHKTRLDLDHVRTKKFLHHYVLLDDGEMKYIWDFDADELSLKFAKAVCAMSQLVTYLGQTTDLVIAHGEVAEDFAEDESKAIYEPQARKGKWQIPKQGTLKACQDRYDRKQNITEFPTPSGWCEYKNKNALYFDAPKVLFKLQNNDGKRLSFEPASMQEASALTRHAWLKFLRDNPGYADEYGADLLARKIAGHESSASEKSVDAPHVAFVPLPSLGKDFIADGKFSRVLVIGYGCESEENSKMFYDIAEKMHGKPLVKDENGEKVKIGELEKLDFDEDEEADFDKDKDKVAYRFIAKSRRPFKVWRTVAPIILSGHTKLIDSFDNPYGEKTKVFKKGCAPEDFIIKALREAGIPVDEVESILVSKSPLVPKTRHAFQYKPSKRLSDSPRYHAEIEFKKPIVGSLVIGRGRFAGFGLLMPWR